MQVAPQPRRSRLRVLVGRRFFRPGDGYSGCRYAGSEILVTAATGFVETDLLEKLMSVCPRVVAIFILIRPKTNKTIEQRFKKSSSRWVTAHRGNPLLLSGGPVGPLASSDESPIAPLTAISIKM